MLSTPVPTGKEKPQMQQPVTLIALSPTAALIRQLSVLSYTLDRVFYNTGKLYHVTGLPTKSFFPDLFSKDDKREAHFSCVLL